MAVLAFVLAVNPMVYAKGTELTYEETVCMYGKSEGFGVGEVKSISTVFRDTRLGVVCYGLVKCEWNEGQEAYGAGSSGGPVYAGHVFHGTYTGSNSTGGNFWFSPIDAVPGFSIKTTA